MSTNGNKVAIGTGSSRGIGAAIARRLAADGFTVVINYAGKPAEADAVLGMTALLLWERRCRHPEHNKGPFPFSKLQSTASRGELVERRETIPLAASLLWYD